MHFKSALIVCVVYFLTSAWTVEINIDQLKKLNELFESHNISKCAVMDFEIVQFVEDSFGLNRSDLGYFGYGPERYDSMNLLMFLSTLALKNYKSSEKIKVNTLTSMELFFYLEEFDELVEDLDQPGCLTPQQLSEAFKYWRTLNAALKAKLVEIKTNKDRSYVMNAVDYLLVILDIKPMGLGLTAADIEMFDVLYHAHKTPDGINPEASKQVFQQIGIQIEEDLTQLFQLSGPAGTLLMDLILAAAERNVWIDENEWRVLSLWEIASFMHGFKKLDGDEDGVLSPDEYADFKAESKNKLKSMEGTAEAMGKAHYYLNKFDGEINLNTVNNMLSTTTLSVFA